jgi:hypothetical protein
MCAPGEGAHTLGGRARTPSGGMRTPGRGHSRLGRAHMPREGGAHAWLRGNCNISFNQEEKPIVFKVRSKGRLGYKQGLN